MVLTYEDSEQVMEGLTKQARVAVCASCVEHALDLYKLGDSCCTVGVVKGLDVECSADKDLVEWGLELLWTFAEHGRTKEAAANVVADWLEPRFVNKPSNERAAGAAGTLAGLYHSLQAIHDDSIEALEDAMCKTEVGIALSLGQLGFATDDNDLSQQASDDELAWQMRVVERLAEHGDAPITRELVADLIAEELPWREHLPAYKKTFQG